MTLDDLTRIFKTYVPAQSRHPNARDGAQWWPAHEIGHLLTALPDELGRPFFGYAPDDLHGRVHEALLVECSAMSISRKLLVACGRRDITEQEAEDTDHETMMWWDEHSYAVSAFCVERGCARIPRTVTALEAMAKAKRALMPRRRTPSLWVRRAPDQPRYTCDTCTWAAIWCHPRGGLRCRRCPRP